jgi:transposase
VENHGYVVAPLVVRPVNVNDTVLLPACVEGFMDLANLLGLDTCESTTTWDAGFDSHANHDRLLFHEVRPIIKPNRGRQTNQEKINERLDAFDKETYKQRFKIERTYAWQDSYRKLAVRYEILEATHLGFKYLAYSMMNLKTLI